MHRQGYDLQLTRYDERGWRATFYTTGMEHSPTSATEPDGSARRGTRRATGDKEKSMLAEWLALVPLFAAILLAYLAHPARSKSRGRGVTRTSVEDRRR
jgi:hypothetical protein